MNIRRGIACEAGHNMRRILALSAYSLPSVDFIYHSNKGGDTRTNCPTR
ncbi:MAG: hypothetical protein LBQ24_00480 [Candidatus Peribacteria bacterium]|nr:hypothetical protein [Candidatus Peribacteria bacterium]